MTISGWAPSILLSILLTFGLIAAISLGFAHHAPLGYWISIVVIGALLQGFGLAGQHSFKHLRLLPRLKRWLLYLLLIAVVIFISANITPGKHIVAAAMVVVCVILTEIFAYLEGRYKWE